MAVGTPAFSRSYTYDELNRLKTLSAPGETCAGLSWTYDIWANRTHQTTTGGTCGQSQLTIDTKNRIVDTGFSYDAAGNMTAEPGRTYQYDAENRMVSVNNGCGGSGPCYVYDANGRRVRKTARGVELEITASNQELAAQIGTVREMVSRNLSRLQAEGLIEVQGRMVVILRIEALEAEAGAKP